MEEFYIKPRRPNRTLVGVWAKIHVPVPMSMKADVVRLCREWSMSQAELGLRLVSFVMRYGFLLDAALRDGLPAAGAERSLSSTAPPAEEVDDVWRSGEAEGVRARVEAEESGEVDGPGAPSAGRGRPDGGAAACGGVFVHVAGRAVSVSG